MEQRRLGILTSGGDCPGLNAVIRAVTRSAILYGWEVLGFHDGYEGLLTPVSYQVLDEENTAGIMPLGGTILGTTNKGRFVAKVKHGEVMTLGNDIINEVKQTMATLNLEGLICIGGDGSLTTANQLFEAGINTIGVPKTIDNDIEATAMTFGFDSAVACVVDALDRLHTTARSHKRVMVVEVMGRYAGWIALHGGMAGGADIILIPEIPFDFEKVFATIRKRETAGYTNTMIVVAEGALEKDGTYTTKKDTGLTGEHKLGGVAARVAAEIEKNTGKETRSVVLGHLQRGGDPTSLDRILGSRFGVGAVDLARQGLWGHMVSYQNYLVNHVPIIDAVKKIKTVKPDSQLVGACREMGIRFGD
jgi:6-phosphofructokinase 1